MRRLAESHTADKGGTEPGLETRIQTASLCPLSGQALFLSKFSCYKQKHFKDIWAVFIGGIFLFQKVNSTFLVRIWREQFCLWFSNAPLLLLFSHSQNIKYGLESKSGWPKGNLESVPSEGWLSAQVLSPMKTVLWEACELQGFDDICQIIIFLSWYNGLPAQCLPEWSNVFHHCKLQPLSLQDQWANICDEKEIQYLSASNNEGDWEN